jgi:hypothetical protein
MVALMAPANVLLRLPDCVLIALTAEHAPVDELLSSPTSLAPLHSSQLHVCHFLPHL